MTRLWLELLLGKMLMLLLGYRDVVVTIVGAVFLFGVIYAQDYLASNGFYFFKRYCYLPDVFLAIVSGVFGYVPGVVAGISGRVLAGMLGILSESSLSRKITSGHIMGVKHPLLFHAVFLVFV